MGIICDDFELLLKKNKAILEELTDNITKIKNMSNMFNSNFYSSELKFLVSKLDMQLSQFGLVEEKLIGYQRTLNSVFDGYNEQEAQVVRDVSSLIS